VWVWDKATQAGTIYGQSRLEQVKYLPNEIAMTECVGQRALPVNLHNASSEATGWILGKVLKRYLGLAVEDAGPIATAGAIAGAVIGCAAEGSR